MKITLLRIISVVATAAALFTLPNMEAAESKKKRKLVEVLPFEPSMHGRHRLLAFGQGAG